MEMFIYFFCAYLIEGIAFWLYCSTLFITKRTVLIKGLWLCLLYGILAVIFSLDILWLNLVLFLLANFIFIFLMYDTSINSALFHSSVVTAVMGLSELVIVSFFPSIMFNFHDSPNYKSNYILLLFLTKIPYLILLYTIAHLLCKAKEKRQASTRVLILLVSIPIASIWILSAFFDICLDYKLSIIQNRQVTISAFLLLIINIITWIIYTYTQRKNREFTTLQLQLQKEQDTTEYYKMLLQQNENQQILIHDIKKHLNSLSLLNEQGQSEKISAYIQQLINSSDLQSTARMCDNELLNAILSRYARQCMELKIDFHADIRSGVVDFMADNDLTSLFCNLLDNSLEAAKTYPNGYIELGVANHPHTTMTIITLVNSCRVNPFDKYGKLTSKKVDTLRHGFGLRSIERIVKCYNGEMKQYYNEEDYTFHTIIMLRRPQK